MFNYDIPEDIEYYVHRIGRTGRAGKSGKSFTLVGGREMYKLREIEKVCHTRIEERRVPNAKEITRVKSQKVFAEVIDIIENGDITSALEFVNQKVEEGEYTAEQLAAGFMKLKMGADIQELLLFENKESKRDRYRRTGERLERRSRDGKDRERRKSGDNKREDKKRKEKTREEKKRDLKPQAEKKSSGKKGDVKSKKKKPAKANMDKISQILDMSPSELGSLDIMPGGRKPLDKKTLDKKLSEKAVSAEHAAKTGNGKPKSERRQGKKPADASPFENVGHINIKGEGSTKAWYVGEDSDTMNISKAEKKSIKAQNKKRSLDYLQDMSDLVMESFGKRKNREKK